MLKEIMLKEIRYKTSPNVISFQRKVESTEGLIKGTLLRGIWHLNVELKILYPGQSQYTEPDGVYLKEIRAFLPKTRIFGGSRALNWLVSLADKFEVSMRLHVEPYYHKALNYSELRSFYERRDFQFVERDLAGRDLLERKPMV